MEQKHSPGPWELREFTNEDGYVLYEFSQKGRYGGFVATIDTGLGNLCEDENHANAHLIAAAPDLLEACKAALITCDKPYPTALEQLRTKLQSTIASATGKGT